MGGTNYVGNPSLETSTASWGTTNGTLGRDATQTAPGSGTWCGVVSSSGGVTSVNQGAIGLTVGRHYMASIFVLIPVGGAMDTNGIGVYGSCTGASGQGTAWTVKEVGVWVRARLGFVATSSTQTITWTTESSISAGQSFYVDRMMINEGSIAEPYFDGSYPGCSWTGAAHASTSTCAAFQNYPPTTDEAITVGGLCLNTEAWNVVNRSGRGTIPAQRGQTTVVPSRSGSQFIANRPYDNGVWGIGMWVLGMMPDGSIPRVGEHRAVFERNFARLQQALTKNWQPVTLAAWQADGSVRTAAATLASQVDITSMLGGRRAEIPFVFDILAGWWKDALTSTTTGTAGSGWSNQALNLPLLAGGTAPIEDAVITVTGPATAPVRITTDSGVWVQCNTSIGAGTTWVFDCGAWTSTRAGTSNLSEVTHGGHPRFLSIPPGELLATPKVTMTAAGGTSSATNLALTAARSHWDA